MNFPTVNLYTIISDTLSTAWDSIQVDKSIKEGYSEPAYSDNIYAEPIYDDNQIDIYA